MKRISASIAGLSCLLLTVEGVDPVAQRRFRTSTDAVLVDVQVTAGGKPVTGLTAEDFELRDSGVRQSIVVDSLNDVPISLVLALDLSSSVEGQRLEQLKRAAKAAIAALRSEDQAAIVTFNDRITLASGWTRDQASLRTRIDGLQAGGWTALYDAIFAATALSHTAAGRVIVLVFSDGADTTSSLDANAVLESAGQADVVITAVSAAPAPGSAQSGREARRSFGLHAALRRHFGENPGLFPYPFLEVLAGEAGGQLLRVGSEREIAAAFRQIVSDFKNRYLLTYSPKDVPASGWHPIEVRLTKQRGDVRTRRGYWR